MLTPDRIRHIMPLPWQHIKLTGGRPGSMNGSHEKGFFGRSDRPHPFPAGRRFGHPLRRGGMGYFRRLILGTESWDRQALVFARAAKRVINLGI